MNGARCFSGSRWISSSSSALQLVQRGVGGRRFRRPDLSGYLFVLASSHGDLSEIAGTSEGDAVKPTGEGHCLANGGRVARQNEKRRLKCVFGIRVLPKNASANPQHQSAMPTHQHGERRLIPLFDEAPDQVGICPVRSALGQKHALKVAENGIRLAARHKTALAGKRA